MSETLEPAREQLNARVFAAQVELLFESSPRNLAASLGGSSLAAALFYRQSGSLSVLVWWLALGLVTAARYALVRRFRLRRPAAAEAPAWARRATLGALAAGALWGLGLTTLAPPWGSGAYVLAVFMLTGVPAAALGSNVAVFPNFLAILLPFLLPYAGQLLLTGEIDQVTAGLAALIYAAALAGIGRASSRRIAESFALRFENVDLVERLSTANEFLQREITRRQETEEGLRLAKDGAEAANQAKSRFLAKMSHEIRTPMNGVLGMTELLLESPLSSQQRRFGEIIDDSARSLLQIIDDILDFSRVEAGKLRLEEEDFDIRETVVRAVELLSSRALGKGLQLTWSVADAVPVRARGDSGRLRQVLLNLIANAIKFTAAGSVAVRAGLEPGTAPDSPCVRFTVEDTGIGLSPQARQRLFEPFAQADESAARRFGGTGLGLAICRQLVDLMGGRIEAESETGKGARFSFVVPLAAPRYVLPPAAARAPRELAEDETALGGTVLVVEDNAVNREVAVAILLSLGCAVEVAEDGASAVTASARQRYDAILMDCEMPGMDGYAATAAIRARESAERAEPVPIIALSAHAMPGDRERALAAGLDDYLTKPVSPLHLRRTLARWFEKGSVSAPEAVRRPGANARP